MKRITVTSILISSFIFSSLLFPIQQTFAASTLVLPKPGTMLELTPTYHPAILKGLSIHPNNPLMFDFILDLGDEKLEGEALKTEGDRQIKYFLAALAIPEQDLWVNLSPYEKERTLGSGLEKTQLGEDLLAQDYLLKQLSASLIYPEKEIGKNFWSKIYTDVQSKYGQNVHIPVDAFNKIWIMADRAEVVEQGQTAAVATCHLKVMLEEDYLAKYKNSSQFADPATTGVSQIMRDSVIPAIEQEVNEGKHFAPLRQIFAAIILANWYKSNLKEALLNQTYANQKIMGGIDQVPQENFEQIFAQYVAAYKKGVFDLVKEEPLTNGKAVARKYFAGGVTMGVAGNPETSTDMSMLTADSIKGALVRFRARLVNAAKSLPNLMQRSTNVEAILDEQMETALRNSEKAKTIVSGEQMDVVHKIENEGFYAAYILLKGKPGDKSKATTASMKEIFQDVKDVQLWIRTDSGSVVKAREDLVFAKNWLFIVSTTTQEQLNAVMAKIGQNKEKENFWNEIDKLFGNHRIIHKEDIKGRRSVTIIPIAGQTTEVIDELMRSLSEFIKRQGSEGFSIKIKTGFGGIKIEVALRDQAQLALRKDDSFDEKNFLEKARNIVIVILSILILSYSGNAALEAYRTKPIDQVLTTQSVDDAYSQLTKRLNNSELEQLLIQFWVNLPNKADANFVKNLKAISIKHEFSDSFYDLLSAIKDNVVVFDGNFRPYQEGDKKIRNVSNRAQGAAKEVLTFIRKSTQGDRAMVGVIREGWKNIKEAFREPMSQRIAPLADVGSVEQMSLPTEEYLRRYVIYLLEAGDEFLVEKIYEKHPEVKNVRLFYDFLRRLHREYIITLHGNDPENRLITIRKEKRARLEEMAIWGVNNKNRIDFIFGKDQVVGWIKEKLKKSYGIEFIDENRNQSRLWRDPLKEIADIEGEITKNGSSAFILTSIKPMVITVMPLKMRQALGMSDLIKRINNSTLLRLETKQAVFYLRIEQSKQESDPSRIEFPSSDGRRIVVVTKQVNVNEVSDRKTLNASIEQTIKSLTTYPIPKEVVDRVLGNVKVFLGLDQAMSVFNPKDKTRLRKRLDNSESIRNLKAELMFQKLMRLEVVASNTPALSEYFDTILIKIDELIRLRSVNKRKDANKLADNIVEDLVRTDFSEIKLPEPGDVQGFWRKSDKSMLSDQIAAVANDAISLGVISAIYSTLLKRFPELSELQNLKPTQIGGFAGAASLFAIYVRNALVFAVDSVLVKINASSQKLEYANINAPKFKAFQQALTRYLSHQYYLENSESSVPLEKRNDQPLSKNNDVMTVWSKMLDGDRVIRVVRFSKNDLTVSNLKGAFDEENGGLILEGLEAEGFVAPTLDARIKTDRFYLIMTEQGSLNEKLLTKITDSALFSINDPLLRELLKGWDGFIFQIKATLVFFRLGMTSTQDDEIRKSIGELVKVMLKSHGWYVWGNGDFKKNNDQVGIESIQDNIIFLLSSSRIGNAEENYQELRKRFEWALSMAGQMNGLFDSQAGTVLSKLKEGDVARNQLDATYSFKELFAQVEKLDRNADANTIRVKVPKLVAVSNPNISDIYGEWERIYKLQIEVTIDNSMTIQPGVINQIRGGIDLAQTSTATAIAKKDQGVAFNLDPAQIEQIKKDGIQSLTPVILSITPVSSIWSD